MIDPWLFEQVKDSAREVLRELGIGHTEAVYEAALEVELAIRDIPVRRQVPCQLTYKLHPIGTGLIDMLINESLVVEVKAAGKLSESHEAQLRKYLLSRNEEAGLLINFCQANYLLESVEVSIESQAK